MFERVVLGAVQGIAEWLPVSSEGLIVLLRVNFFGAGGEITGLIRYALFLHFGTFLAALLYFWSDVRNVIFGTFRYLKAESETVKLINFLAVSTFSSAIVAFAILRGIGAAEERLAPTGKGVTVFIGILLLVTAGIQLRKGAGGIKTIKDSGLGDSMLVGALQGLSVLPGISRSGITVAALLLRRYDDTESLRLSFLMSLPAVLGGSLLLNLEQFAGITSSALAGVAASFAFGLLTVHALMKVARKVNFGWFVLAFGVLTIASAFV